MKTIVILLTFAVYAVCFSGCAAGVSVGNRGQHGTSVSTKTEGPKKGVHASVY